MKKEGPFAVVRDSSGRIAHRQLDQGNPKKNWRHFARLSTNNGLDLFEVMVKIARGEPLQSEMTLPTGEVVQTAPQVPPPAVQLAAAKEVFEFIHGKAVAATEVIRAEEETQQLERLRAMSDMELMLMLERGDEEGELIVEPAEQEPAEQEPASAEIFAYDPDAEDEG